jgi:hypothetical protein
MLDINLETMTELDILRAFVPNGMEEEALTGSYSELIDVIGHEATLKLYKHFRGCKIDCPKFFYRQDYVVALATNEQNKRIRAKIAVASGYTANRLEVLVGLWKKQQ